MSVNKAPDGDPCPSLTDVLRAREDELSRSRRRAIAAHLERCPSCRAAVRRVDEETEAHIDALAVEFEAWAHGEGYLAFRRLLQARAMADARPPVRIWRWLPASALIVLALAGLVIDRSTETVQADELVQRAVTYERTRKPGVVERVRLQFVPSRRAVDSRHKTHVALPPFWLVRTVTDGVTGDPWPRPDAPQIRQQPATISFAQLMREHGFHWQRPLTVADFQAWRSSRTGRRDDVSRPTSGLLRLRTVTSDGGLREVQLTVERETYRPVEQVLVFDSLGRLEITVLGDEFRPQPAYLAAETSVTVRPVGPGTDVLDLAELDARLALRRGNLDLRGFRVSRGHEHVRVTGVVRSARERQNVEGQFANQSLVRVALSLSMPDAEAAKHAEEDLRESVAPEPSRDVALTDPASARDLSGAVNLVRRHLAVMQDLAQRFPSRTHAPVSQLAHAKLEGLLALHFDALRVTLDSLDAQLAGRLRLSGRRPLPRALVPVDWQTRTAHALAHVQEMQQLIEALSQTPANEANAGDAREIGRLFEALWRDVNASQR